MIHAYRDRANVSAGLTLPPKMVRVDRLFSPLDRSPRAFSPGSQLTWDADQASTDDSLSVTKHHGLRWILAHDCRPNLPTAKDEGIALCQVEQTTTLDCDRPRVKPESDSRMSNNRESVCFGERLETLR